MAQLLTVAEFAEECKKNGVDRFNSPQKINKAIRDLSAPVDTALWDDWSKDIPVAQGKGNTRKTSTHGGKSLRPDQIRNNPNGVDENDFLVYQSGATKGKVYAAQVTNIMQEGLFLQIDSYYTEAPIYYEWKYINEQIKEGKMKVGKIGDMLYLLEQELNRRGDGTNARIVKSIVGDYQDPKHFRGGI